MTNLNFNFSASIFIFIGAIALSYFTDIGWWSLAGLFYLLYTRIDLRIIDYVCLGLSTVFFIIAMLKMGWVF